MNLYRELMMNDFTSHKYHNKIDVRPIKVALLFSAVK